MTGIPVWHARAACVGLDVNAFFPPVGTTPRMALKVCKNCPVRAECGEWALSWPELWGVWGGLTEHDRVLARRRERRARRLAEGKAA